MKYTLFISFVIGMANNVIGQAPTTGSYRIICLESSDNIFLIDAVNLTTQDTVTIISLPAAVPRNRQNTALRVGGEYSFDISDIDLFMRKEGNPSRLPYLMQSSHYSLSRFARDGHSIETTQYLVRNTWGMHISREHVLKD